MTSTVSSFEARKKQKDDAKKRQTGELAPETDVASGKIINPHNPEFITKVPWYLGDNNGPTLTHHTVQKQDHYLSLTEAEQLLEQKNLVKQSLASAPKQPTVYKKGSCKNCGSLTHTEKECIERPRSVKKSAWKTGIATASAASEVVMNLEDHGKISYDAKRDNWKGYDPKQYSAVVEQFELVEAERRRIKHEEAEKMKKLKEEQLKEKEAAKKLAREKKVDSDGNVVEDESSSESDSDSDAESDVDSFDEGENEGERDIKKEFLNADENARDFQYKFGRQGGVGGNEFKMTSRNLRIREDTPKYLRNLALNSAYYDPKSRSMRANPYPDAAPEDLVYAGDNFLRNSGDALKLAQAQVLCWENQGGTGEDGQILDVISNPSQAESLQKQLLERKQALLESKKRAIEEKYGDTSAMNSQEKSLDIRLRLGQTEAYIEYSKDGRIVKGGGVEKPLSRVSKYEEDIFINNHTSVWGSFYNRAQGAWGYACCHSLVKNSYCVGAAGKKNSSAIRDTASSDMQKTQRLLDKASSSTQQPSSIRIGSSSANHVKRSDLYGESSLPPSAQLDVEKVQQAVQSFKQQQSKDSLTGEGRKRGAGYNSMQGSDVTLEDMEAYRLTKLRRDDPMASNIE